MKRSSQSVQLAKVLCTLLETNPSIHLIFSCKRPRQMKRNWLVSAASFVGWNKLDHCFLDNPNQMEIQ